MTGSGYWLGLLGLGAFHGLNPAMGWLFAVAIGLQERQLRALLRALVPIALGHALAVAAWVAALLFGLQVFSDVLLRRGAALVLLGFGLWRLVSQRHFNWVGLRVTGRELLLWSFLMATAHGAGLMLSPFILASPITDQPPADAWLMGLLAIGIHSLGHVLVAAVIAWLVYARLGLALLRQAWFNLDLLWALVLIAAAGWLLIAS